MKVSLGTISNTEGIVSEALAVAHVEAHEHVKQAPVKNVDETGHAGPEGKTAWVASTPQATCIKVGLDRSRASLEGFIDVNVGGHRLRPLRRLQLGRTWSMTVVLGTHCACLQVARRRRRRARKSGPDVAEHVPTTTKTTRRNRSAHSPKSRELELVVVEVHLAAGPAHAGARVRARARIAVVVHDTRRRPTNNLAERDLRPLVMWRKTSFGTESLRGDRFIERVLTVKQTLRRYGPGLYAFVVDSVKAKLAERLPRRCATSTKPVVDVGVIATATSSTRGVSQMLLSRAFKSACSPRISATTSEPPPQRASARPTSCDGVERSHPDIPLDDDTLAQLIPTIGLAPPPAKPVGGQRAQTCFADDCRFVDVNGSTHWPGRHDPASICDFWGLSLHSRAAYTRPEQQRTVSKRGRSPKKHSPENRKPALTGGFPAERLFTIPEQQPSVSKAVSHSSAASPWEATGMVCRFACERDDDVHDSTTSASRRRFGVLEYLSSYAVPAAPKGSPGDQGHRR